MKVVAKQLTTGGGVSATSFTTASITIDPGQLILVAVFNNTNTPNTPTVSGLNATFTQVNSVVNGNIKMTLFRAIGNGNTGTLTIDFAGQSQFDCIWTVCEMQYTKTGGTNASDAIVQSATNSAGSGATTASVSLSAFADTQNATYMCMGENATNSLVPSGSLTLLSQNTANGQAAGAAWQDSNNTNPSISMSGSGGNAYVAIAAEIAHQSQSGLMMGGL